MALGHDFWPVTQPDPTRSLSVLTQYLECLDNGEIAVLVTVSGNPNGLVAKALIYSITHTHTDQNRNFIEMPKNNMNKKIQYASCAACCTITHANASKLKAGSNTGWPVTPPDPAKITHYVI